MLIFQGVTDPPLPFQPRAWRRTGKTRRETKPMRSQEAEETWIFGCFGWLPPGQHPKKLHAQRPCEKKIHDFLGWNLSLKENKNIWKKPVKNPHFKQQLWCCHSLPGKTVNQMAVFRWKLPWSTWPASIPTPLLRMASSKVARSHRCEPWKMDGSQGTDGLVGTLRIGLWGPPSPPRNMAHGYVMITWNLWMSSIFRGWSLNPPKEGPFIWAYLGSRYIISLKHDLNQSPKMNECPPKNAVHLLKPTIDVQEK